MDIFTDFGWYEQDGNKTLECEEVEDRVNVKDGDKQYCGCRYVHSFLNMETGLPTHLDGAIRAYNEEQIIERLDEKIDKAGRNTFYICYPSEHRKLYDEIIQHGCVVSEYPPGIRPERYMFPKRNRLIAALSDELYVIDAGSRSGTESTVKSSRKYGRNIVRIEEGSAFDNFSERCWVYAERERKIQHK